ncbi:hypothetical protein [Bacillus massiliigorillae]|uniref:hypothetical protein n=1 Tax=Bacillus massiliigorillae TaxID=1243664 RepID=UPI0003A77C97|nr:hypothetical protein [Bacillus massiliigorillae]
MNQQNNQFQNQQPSTNQVVYPEPPAVLTTKDELYLTDMMSWNLVIFKKAAFYAQHCQDPEIKQAIQTVGQMHQKQYDSFLSHLGLAQNGGATPLQ